MLLTRWHPITCRDGIADALTAHLHGRDLTVEEPAWPAGMEPRLRWHWLVVTPSGRVLAEGNAADRTAAEVAAEDEVEAVHPPTEELIEALLS